MNRRPSIHAAAPLVLGAALLATRTASAINCDDASLPNPLYIVGSTAVKPYMAALGQALAGTTTIIYNGQGSCVGVDAIFNGTKTMGTASYWDAKGTLQTCTIDPATGVTVDVGVSDVFSSSCAGFSAPPSSIGDFFGPNQVMNFVVPTASSQTILSAQAAYFAFGFGANGGVTPWTNESFLFQRGATSGTQSMIAAAIAVPPTKWKGVVESSSGNMLTAVTSSATPEATLGIMASDVADANRSTLRILAYQHYGQDCAWLPDSSATAFDKKNVRDGHYPIWGPIHFFAPINASKVPTNPAVATFIGYFTGTSTPPAGREHARPRDRRAHRARLRDERVARHGGRPGERGGPDVRLPLRLQGDRRDHVHGLHDERGLHRLEQELPLRLLRGELR